MPFNQNSNLDSESDIDDSRSVTTNNSRTFSQREEKREAENQAVVTELDRYRVMISQLRVESERLRRIAEQAAQQHDAAERRLETLVLTGRGVRTEFEQRPFPHIPSRQWHGTTPTDQHTKACGPAYLKTRSLMPGDRTFCRTRQHRNMDSIRN